MSKTKIEVEYEEAVVALREAEMKAADASWLARQMNDPAHRRRAVIARRELSAAQRRDDRAYSALLRERR